MTFIKLSGFAITGKFVKAYRGNVTDKCRLKVINETCGLIT